MTQVQHTLYNEILLLPIEKIGKAISFIRFLEQEPEPELFIDSAEENELHDILTSGETIGSSDLLVKIKALPDG